MPPPTTVKSGGTSAKSATTVRSLAPGISATTELDTASGASAAFSSFVANAKISGVYQGTPSRAFINGRMVHSGEMIDDGLEIYFDSVDLPARSIVFKDSRGATVSRRY